MRSFEEMRDDLIQNGYVEVEEFRGLRVGDRVRHCGEQFRRAYTEGTAEVLGIYEKPGSSWSRSYGRPDVELIVRRDRPLMASLGHIYTWADYHTVRVEVQS